MLAYTNTTYTKKQAVALATKHYKQDNFIQGEFWTGDKGCSVGCMVHAKKGSKGWHEATEPLYGIPRVLSLLQDRIFEGLPLDEAKKWTVRFISAIPDGADLSMVITKLMHWLMTDKEGVLKHARPDGIKAIKTVAKLYKKKLDGKIVTDQEWIDARTDAADAAYAAYAAAADAAYAAYAAADAAAYARKQQWVRTADKLIEILENTHVNDKEN